MQYIPEINEFYVSNSAFVLIAKSTIKRMLKHPKPDDTLSIKLIST